MRRATVIAQLAIVLAIVAAAPGAPAAAAEWHSEQPTAAGIGVPVPLGPVGDIEFWAPNRGVLITAGNEGMPAGVYAYDGIGWHLYSTVCGGHDGRIVWTGPTEFWTVSDYATKQEGVEDERLEQRRTLCHFRDGQVVASHAEPFGTAETYLPMSAAACAGPSDCWFAGERLPGDPNVGAFHLHWDGASLTSIPSLTEAEPELSDPGRSVEDLVFFQGGLFESVRVDEGDQAPGETESSLIHRIEPSSAQPFVPLFPTYGPGASADTVFGGLRFTADGSELWALAGSDRPEGLTAFHYAGGGFVQIPLTQPDPPLLKEKDSVEGVAAEPGSDRVWVGLCHVDDFCSPTYGGRARLISIRGDGSVGPEVALPASSEELNNKGFAGPIACPAAGQCWMATSMGWLFHLGGSLPQDTDPAMHQLISSRPCDNSCRSIPPVGIPVDDSGELAAGVNPELPPIEKRPKPPKPARPIAFKVKQRVVDGTILQLSFTLRTRAHVQLLAKRGGRTVAKTPSLTMDRGRHRLRLRLDPKRWPTDLKFKVRAAGRRSGK
ncbi:MAG TPA: hypothetical protein VFI03_03195 [Solirubrobacterales bacterium]|nr:hypothetical protein [Solirubrobacterales bacterium]